MRHSLTLAATVLLGLAACAPADSATPAQVSPQAVVVDVRTPAEYAEGHLEGAVLIDFNSGDVARAIPELDEHAQYLVYCRSGNRAGQTVDLMKAAGITNVQNLGSLAEAAEATGLPIVR